MAKTFAVRQDVDGSIDFDFHRSRSVALRRRAMRDSVTRRRPSAATLVMAGVIGVAIATSAADGTVRGPLAGAWPAPSRTP
jgi:hypothetical protein